MYTLAEILIIVIIIMFCIASAYGIISKMINPKQNNDQTKIYSLEELEKNVDKTNEQYKSTKKAVDEVKKQVNQISNKIK
jgi:hypothetical protein